MCCWSRRTRRTTAISVAGIVHQYALAHDGHASAVHPKEQTWIDEHPVITVSMTPAFIPLSDSKQLNAYAGISLDYLRLLSRIIGIQFRIEPQSNWTTALEDAKQWRTDLFAMVEPTLPSTQTCSLPGPIFPSQASS